MDQREGTGCSSLRIFSKMNSLLIIALIVGLIQGDMNILLENVGVLVVVLLGPVGRIVRYLTTRYAVEEEKLVVKSGLFKKEELEVPPVHYYHSGFFPECTAADFRRLQTQYR